MSDKPGAAGPDGAILLPIPAEPKPPCPDAGNERLAIGGLVGIALAGVIAIGVINAIGRQADSSLCNLAVGAMCALAGFLGQKMRQA